MKIQIYDTFAKQWFDYLPGITKDIYSQELMLFGVVKLRIVADDTV